MATLRTMHRRRKLKSHTLLGAAIYWVKVKGWPLPMALKILEGFCQTGRYPMKLKKKADKLARWRT